VEGNVVMFTPYVSIFVRLTFEILPLANFQEFHAV